MGIQDKIKHDPCARVCVIDAQKRILYPREIEHALLLVPIRAVERCWHEKTRPAAHRHHHVAAALAHHPIVGDPLVLVERHHLPINHRQVASRATFYSRRGWRYLRHFLNGLRAILRRGVFRIVTALETRPRGAHLDWHDPKRHGVRRTRHLEPNAARIRWRDEWDAEEVLKPSGPDLLRR